MTKEAIIKTLGCRLNTYESSIISKILIDLNMQDDFMVINTCTVTNESDRKSRQEVRKLKKEYPEKKILVTGCASELHTELFKKMPEVEFVIGNNFKTTKSIYQKIKDYYSNNLNKEELQKILVSKELPHVVSEEVKEDIGYLYDFKSRTRAFVAIHNGCNHYCSFCIIPFVRGKFKSIPEDIIIEQVKRFVDNGYNEVVLTGVDITDYGIDWKDKKNHSLGKLCKMILEQTKLPRLRLSSVDVAEIDDDIKELVKIESRFMPYFHISVQSGDNEILKKMRRRHNHEDVIAFCSEMMQYRSDIAFGADIITGFAGETLEQFENSLKIVQNAPISFVHAFPYSKKIKTLAYSMPDLITKQEKKRRVQVLIDAGRENLKALHLKMLNKKQVVVCEKGFIGKTENFIDIKLNITDKTKYKVGSLQDVVPTELDENGFLVANLY